MPTNRRRNRKAKTPSFTLKDYTRLCKINTLADGICEIVSRNNEFRSDYKALSKSVEEAKSNMQEGDLYKVTVPEFRLHNFIEEKRRQLFKEYKVLVPFKFDYRALVKSKRLKVRVAPSIQVSRIPKNREHEEELKGDDRKFDEVLSTTVDELRVGGKHGLTFNYPDNSLVVVIDLDSSKEIIEESLRDALKRHKVRKSGNLCLGLWPFYLMVYDLKKEGLTYAEIVSFIENNDLIHSDMTETFRNPDDDSGLKEKLKKYHGEARKLIDKKQYIKYL